jgi:hypothetical protein
MATIHTTTLTPSKLELLASWLPGQPWYRGDGAPRLAKAGGFRLDDPQGEVGVEVLLVADGDGTVYATPLTYRGAPLPGGEPGLVGTTEHGVLGRRWVYDAVHDPVGRAALVALVRGRAVPQHQSLSDTPDPSVTVEGSVPAGGEVHLEVVRVVSDDPAAAPEAGVAHVTVEAGPPSGRRVVVVATSIRA